MSADDEVDRTRAEIKAAADLIARLRKEREQRGNPFDEPDDPGGGRRSVRRTPATRTKSDGGRSPRRSGVSGPGIG
jgi:hypothetical protein